MAKSVGSVIVKLEADVGRYKKDMDEAGKTTRNVGKYATEANFRASAAGKALARTSREVAAQRRTEASMTNLVTREIATNIGISDRLSSAISNAARAYGAFGRKATAAQRALALTSLKAGVVVAGIQGWATAINAVIGLMKRKVWGKHNENIEHNNWLVGALDKSYSRLNRSLSLNAALRRANLEADREWFDSVKDVEREERLLAAVERKAELARQGRDTDAIDRLFNQARSVSALRGEMMLLRRSATDAGKALPDLEVHAKAAKSYAEQLQEAVENAKKDVEYAEIQERARGKKGEQKLQELEDAKDALEKARDARDKAMDDMRKASSELEAARSGRVTALLKVEAFGMRARKQLLEEHIEDLRRARQEAEALAKAQGRSVGMVLGQGSVESWNVQREARTERAIDKLVDVLMQERVSKITEPSGLVLADPELMAVLNAMQSELRQISRLSAGDIRL